MSEPFQAELPNPCEEPTSNWKCCDDTEAYWTIIVYFIGTKQKSFPYNLLM